MCLQSQSERRFTSLTRGDDKGNNKKQALQPKTDRVEHYYARGDKALSLSLCFSVSLFLSLLL